MKKIFPFSLTAMLILAIALSGCGSGGGGSSPNPDEQAINSLFNSIGIDASSFFSSDNIASSIAPVHSDSSSDPYFTWNSVIFTANGYTQRLTNIIFDSATAAHATANFSVSAAYTITGYAIDSYHASWSNSGTLTLSGSGTIKFVKTDGAWSVDAIPDAIYLSSSTSSPTIENLSIPARTSTGQTETFSGTMTSKDTQYFAAYGHMTGFKLTGFTRIGHYDRSSGSYNISEDITFPSFTGNIYGVISIIELASDGYYISNTRYLNACAYIGMIKETTGS